MVERFHVELKETKKDVDRMGSLAKKMLTDSVEALKNRDTELAEKVYSKKIDIADMDYEIEKKAFRLIALYQPMARDMREIACILKMITYLTRIGRYGKDIAKITMDEFSNKPHVKKMVSIPYMADIVKGMIEDALKAFEIGDISVFNDFADRESTVDEMRYSIFRECLSYMMENPKNIKACTEYIIIARYLERCGDHACKMAEKIIFMVKGERVEIDCREETSKSCFVGVNNSGKTKKE
ncbi:MAG: phosphate signaling complex protein PhoU [Candidatus Thermoplasmatota archaeon]